MIAQYGQGANDGNRDGGVVWDADGFQMQIAVDRQDGVADTLF